MAMVVNTNIAALNAVRILSANDRDHSSAVERLTSGLRINSSADDAAGLAVSTTMTSQVDGLHQAVENANDGISMLQTLDGATEEVVAMLQRMRELGIQALNGTYSDANRQQMDEEYSQLTSEIDRIAKNLTFNDVNLMLNVSASGPAISNHPSGVDLHVGWQAGSANKIHISIANFQVSTNQLYGNPGVIGVSGIQDNWGTNVITSHYVSVGYTKTLLYGQAHFSGELFTYRVLGDTTLASTLGPSAAVNVIDGALSNISEFRSVWGALQNRLESTVKNLSNTSENMQVARSQILDADYAKETAELARTQVLQQAGMSMLAQANNQTNAVVRLLQ